MVYDYGKYENSFYRYVNNFNEPTEKCPHKPNDFPPPKPHKPCENPFEEKPLYLKGKCEPCKDIKPPCNACPPPVPPKSCNNPFEEKPLYTKGKCEPCRDIKPPCNACPPPGPPKPCNNPFEEKPLYTKGKCEPCKDIKPPCGCCPPHKPPKLCPPPSPSNECKPKPCNCGPSFPPCNPPKKDFISDILGDTDKLLIIGLIFLLLKNKSNKYVLIALAYVLLG